MQELTFLKLWLLPNILIYSLLGRQIPQIKATWLPNYIACRADRTVWKTVYKKHISVREIS